MTGNAFPWLSVVLPTHQGERWLGATLDSLVAQTERGFECILVDSSDDGATIAVAERYRDALPIRILRRPDLRDWQSKTNLGVTLAAADHIGMLHQDDLWEPTRAAHVRTWIAARPDITMHLHPSWIVDADGRKLGLWRCPLPAERALPRDLLLERLVVQNFVAICAPVIRKAAFLAAGGLDATLWYTADWDLYLKLAQRGDVVYHSMPLAGYRVHGGALTVTGSRDGAAFADQMTTVLDRYADVIASDRRVSVLARAQTSIAVNTALAHALHKGPYDLARSLLQILRLGPVGIRDFLRDTRLVERLMPRLRARLQLR